MGERRDALMRVWAFIWQVIFGYTGGVVVSIIALIWGAVDVVLQLIFGRDWLSADASAAMIVEETLMWMAEQTIYAFTGGGAGEFRWLPDYSSVM